MNLSYLDFQLHRRVAVLDLGTNTFNIVIAEGNQKEFQILYEEKVAVKIGRGGIQQKIIIQEAQQRALKAMQYYQDILQNYQVDLENVYAFATSAFRNAQNGEDLAALITEITGIEVPIISGAQEATYIYQGVNHALDLSERTNLIMDIGGGSVEFIIANKNRIFWKRSYEIGAQRLWTKFMKNDPIDTVNLSMKVKDLTENRPDYNNLTYKEACEAYGNQVIDIGFELYKYDSELRKQNDVAFDLKDFREWFRIVEHDSIMDIEDHLDNVKADFTNKKLN